MAESEYPPLGPDVLIAEKMAESLPAAALSEICETLWRGDCQTCGSSIVSGPIALYAEATLAIASVSLHHPTCRAPEWNDGGGTGLIRTPKVYGDHTTYIYAGMVIDDYPVVLMNNQLEIAQLRKSSSGWKVSTIDGIRDFHRMFPGGSMPMPPASPLVGMEVQISDSSIKISAQQTYLFEPGWEVLRAIKEKSGLILAFSSIYHGQNLTLLTAGEILRHSTRTTLAWLSLRPEAPSDVPAAEYVVYSNGEFSVAGTVLARYPSGLLAISEVVAWAKEKAVVIDQIPLAHFIDEPGPRSDVSYAWFTDAISLKMYLVLRTRDAWLLIRSYSRYGGPVPREELEQWASSIMRHKSPHRVVRDWFPGPRCEGGMILLSHALPTTL